MQLSRLCWIMGHCSCMDKYLSCRTVMASRFTRNSCSSLNVTPASVRQFSEAMSFKGAFNDSSCLAPRKKSTKLSRAAGYTFHEHVCLLQRQSSSLRVTCSRPA